MKCVRPKCSSPAAGGGRQQGLCHKHYESCPTRGYVNGAHIRLQMREMHSAGFTWKQIADMAGISEYGLYLIRDTNRRVQYQTAAAFAVMPRPHLFGGQGVVPALGIHRRIHALQALGWTQRDLCARLGWQHRRIAMLLCHDRIACSVARQIADLYEELSGEPGPSEKTRRIAVSKGWMPPLAYDDIDDPDEIPSVGEVVKVSVPERYQEFREHVGLSFEQIAAAERIRPDSLERQLYRHGMGRAS